MKTIFKILFVCSIISFQSCTKQSIDIDVIEVACRNFTLERPSYQRLSDPCQGGTSASFDVSFEFRSGEVDCFYSLHLFPDFYDENDDLINNVTFSSQLLKSDPEISIVDDVITFRFDIEFNSAAAANDFNHMILRFNTKTETDEESNSLEIRMNTECSVVNPSSYNVNPNTVNIPGSQTFFTIKLWDNAAEDGDLVSLYLNGMWIIENHFLLNLPGTDFTYSTSLLNPGPNDLVVFALNEGSSGPNTVSISINGQEIENFSPGMLTGEAVQINF